MITISKIEAAAMVADASRAKTNSCPLCDSSVKIASGISLPVACKCGNVWQPAQMFGARGLPTCVATREDEVSESARAVAGVVFKGVERVLSLRGKR